jgi:hypothetical protein
LIESVQHLIGARTYGDVLSEIDPANHAIRIKEKFGRPCNVRSFRTRAWMQEVIAADNFGLGIGKQRKGVTQFLRLPPIDLRRINTDADYANPARIEVCKFLLETPQLGVAERSPKAAIKNQHSSIRTGKQIAETDGCSTLIH